MRTTTVVQPAAHLDEHGTQHGKQASAPTQTQPHPANSHPMRWLLCVPMPTTHRNEKVEVTLTAGRFAHLTESVRWRLFSDAELLMLCDGARGALLDENMVERNRREQTA